MYQDEKLCFIQREKGLNNFLIHTYVDLMEIKKTIEKCDEYDRSHEKIIIFFFCRLKKTPRG